MKHTVIALLAIPLLGHAQTVSMKPSDAGLRVEIDGQLFTEYQAKEGGLSRPRRPGQETELALGHVKRHIAKGDTLRVVSFRDSEGLYHGRSWTRSHSEAQGARL